MNLSTKSLLIIALLLLGTASLLAQESGQISGVVTDVATGEALIGANVTLKGTSLGASSGIDGKYVLYAVPAGTYTLVARYIGYRGEEIAIEVKPGSKLEQNFSLTAQAIEGQEVVVTAQARGQQAAINQQLASDVIMNVVASDRIRELPDQSAAAALSRLPGVSVMNGDQIVIRGIEAKNNIILVNGVQLPSTDINTRAVNLGFISSNMLSGIEVVKSVTPDMDANTIGGVVNLRLMEAPQGLHFDLFSQGLYNGQDRTTDNHKFWASVSNRFFDDKLGVFVQANADRTDAGNDQTTATYARWFGDTEPGRGGYQLNSFAFTDQANITTNYGGSVILDYALPHGKIALQNTFARSFADNAQYRYTMDFTQVNGLNYTLYRDKNFRDLAINALQTEYNIGIIKTDFTVSHSYSNKTTQLRYGDPGDNFGFGNGNDPAPYGYNPDGTPINFTGASRHTLTPADVMKLNINPADPAGASIVGWATTRGEAFTEHVYNSNLDFTIPMSFSEKFSTKIKLGGKFSRFTRSNDLEELYKRVGDDDFYATVRNFFPGVTLNNSNRPLMLTDVWNPGYSGERGKYFMNDSYDIKYVVDPNTMDSFLPLSSKGWVPGRHVANSLTNDFDGKEMFSAGYLMGTFNVGPRLTVIGGARYEHYNMNYKAHFLLITHAVDGLCNDPDTLNTVDRNDDNLLPNIQLRYKATDWAEVRLAYTNTLVRPDYQAIMPRTYYDPNGSAQAGNPRLKPTVSNNYDANVSFFSNKLGLLTIGGFYKQLDNEFFRTNFYYRNLSHYPNLAFPDSATFLSLGFPAPAGGTQVQTWFNNPNPGFIRGIEVEWQTNFWYLPRPLNALVFNINYTRVWSNMDYLQVINTPVPYIDESGRQRFRYVTTDTIRSARLLGQSDHVLNMALGIDYKGFSGRVSFNLQSNDITTVGTRSEEDVFTGTVYRWDLMLRQKLPIEGLSISLDIQNLTHSPTETYQRFYRLPPAQGGTISDNLASTTYGPSYYQISLRYAL